VGRIIKIFSFALSELKNQSKLQLFLVFNLAFGLFGFFLLQTFQESLFKQTQSKAQEILGGDFSVSARKRIDEKLISGIESEFEFSKKSQGYSFFGMLQVTGMSNVHGATKSRLVRVQTFDQNYPLYGKLELKLDSRNVELENGQKKIWLDPEVVSLLGLGAGSKVKLGQTEFEYGGLIYKDPSRTFRMGGFAPVVMISNQDVESTDLLKEGSTISQFVLYKIDPSVKGSNSPNEIQKKLSLKVKDVSIRLETAEQDASDDNRVLKYFSDYLGLVSLVALGLCFLCGGYLLRWIFMKQKKTIAIYKTLGMQESEIIQIYVLKNTVISFGALVIALLAVVVSIPFVQSVLLDFNLPIVLNLEIKSVLITSAIALFVPQLMFFPLMIEILHLSPKELFQPLSEPKQRSKLFWLWLLVCLVLFWALTIWQSQSLKTGTVFTFGLVIIYFIFKFSLILTLMIANKFLDRFSFANNYAMKSLIRKGASTDLVFITMSLSILVLCLLPHVKSSIIDEIKPSSAAHIPSLFMFDIQPDQKNDLLAMTRNAVGKDLELSPMVRARIIKQNDLAYERAQNGNSSFSTREEEEEARFRNRGVNLTYKAALDPSEKVIEGVWPTDWSKKASGENTIPEISLEERYAGRIKAKMGDVLTFDVQGMEISGRVTSIRQVRWTSFKPNFFIVFQPGVLEEAPQMFLSSLGIVDDTQIENFQNTVVEKFPNVSIINVKRAVQDSLVFINQMSVALEGMAMMSIVIGLFVFVILLNTQVRERMSEMNLLQILGMSNARVMQVIARQFSFIILLAVVGGIGLSFLSVFFIMKVIFDIGATFDYSAVINLVLILIPITAIALWYGLKPLKNLSPNDLIRAGE
jgi:putative ABC transport system permease protein